MIMLLQKYFAAFYNLNRVVYVPNQVYHSDFHLTDWKSCADCLNNARNFYNQCYDKEVLSIKTSVL